MAGLSLVGVAPTHRRRGLLRVMYTELHQRIAAAGYPLAGLTASEGGIYGRFGYGPATMELELTIDRRFARFHSDAPDPGGVRVVRPDQHGDELAAIYTGGAGAHRAGWRVHRRCGTTTWPTARTTATVGQPYLGSFTLTATRCTAVPTLLSVPVR
jgi:hypothetical protein